MPEIDDIEKVKTEMQMRSKLFWLDPDKLKSNHETKKYLRILENLEVAARACTDSTAKVDVLTILSKATNYLKKVLKWRS